MFDPVPWFVGGGAEHSPEIARVLAHAATGGAEGVVTPGDMKVQPLAVPGGSVRIAPGSCLLLNRSPGARSETYVGRVSAETNVPITATGSSSGRSDLIIARVEDEQYAPWPKPPVGEERLWPRFKPFVIPDVPAGTRTARELNLNYPALALGRIDLPPSTGVVTAVVDLRQLALPRSERSLQTIAPPAGQQLTQDATWQTWPNFTPSIPVPIWATHVEVLTTIAGVKNIDRADGELRAVFGDFLTGSVLSYDLDFGSGGNASHTLVVPASGAIPENRRGTNAVLKIEGHRLNTGIHPGYLETSVGSTVTFDVQFIEKAV